MASIQRVTSTTTRPVPSNDWIGYRNKCYLFIDQNMNQDELYSHCASLGGHLLTINDESEHNFFRMVLKGHPKYAHTQIRLGLVDEFGLGILTWTTGAIPSYFPRPLPSPPYTSVVMEITLSSDYNYNMIDAATATFNFCELQTQYLGCFNVPSSIQPIISEYQNMDLTLCKQICMGNVSIDGVALIQRTACYCTESLPAVSVTNSLSCNVTCPGNSLQVCGEDDVVNAYTLSNDDIALNCSSLYKAGVWRKGTYRIGNSTEECGSNLFDDTDCPYGWFGRNGTCYQFASLAGMTYTAAETKCFKNGGYLFYPGTQDTRQLFMEVMSYMSLSVDGFWTSVKDELFNSYMRTGDGLIFESNASVDENIYTVFNTTTGLFHSYSNGTFGVICERSPGYVGCKSIDPSSTPIVMPYLRFDMTVTQCVQYCLAHNTAVYSAMRNSECSCYDETVVFGTSGDECEACLGYSAQTCGSRLFAGRYSVYKLSHYASNLASDCHQLMDYGIWIYGHFMIRPQDNNPIMVACFWEIFHAIVVTGDSMTASSYEPPHVPALLSGTELLAIYSPDSVWIPAESDLDPWIQLKLPGDDHMVTGMFFQGRPNPETNQYAEALEVRFKSTVDSSWKSIGSFPGNTDKASSRTVLFPSPFVTRYVRIYPSGTSVALRLGMLGTLMYNVDYASTHMGCYAVFNTTNTAEVQRHASIGSQADCATKCGNTVPFYSYNVISSECSCHAKLSYGQLGQVDCDNSEPFAAEVHRLYEVSCNPPSAVAGSVNVTSFAHVPDVFTVSSSILYTCDAGHEFFLDNTTVRNITCGDDYLWHGDLGDYCRIISCPDFDFPNGTVSTPSIIYNTEVVLTCNIGFTTTKGATNETILCQGDKTWNSTIPVCQVIDCGTPPPIANTLLTDNAHTYGANVTYTCFSSMRFAVDTYSLTSVCGADGEWESIIASCTSYICSDPPTVKHSTMNLINTTIATYSCAKHSHFPDGSEVKIITCNDSFVWEPINECIYNDSLVAQKGASITFVDTKLRQTTKSLVDLVRSESTIDCGDQCLRNINCEAFNYNNVLTDANCKLFSEMIATDVFVSSVDWSYFEVYDIQYLP
ncbi:uncharacterized protein LOC117316345 isoform X1 [Pecten maximus]|uniref:uncharacterized protein LOC117316345 isoform X1 n=1 Tax=Pecten maximus TaxID=6579 RepID=UPI001458289A|nr:uncharacterized protein LOC117316345 isoform X1 [Pecten maximus]